MTKDNTKVFVFIFCLLFILAGCGKPLWEGSDFTHKDRKSALLKAVKWINRDINNNYNFSTFAQDYLEYFYTVGNATLDDEIKKFVWDTGKVYAIKFSHDPHVIKDSVNLFEHIRCTYILQQFGLDITENLEIINKAKKKIPVKDFLDTDLSSNKPDKDDFADDLHDLYYSQALELDIPVDFKDIVPCIKKITYNQLFRDIDDEEFRLDQRVCKNIVTTLSGLYTYNLEPTLLKNEYDYLISSLDYAIELDDPAYVGKTVACLKCFGLDYTHPAIQTAIIYLLENQKEDGSWMAADTDEDEALSQFFCTWGAITALSEYNYKEQGPFKLEYRDLLIEP